MSLSLLILSIILILGLVAGLLSIRRQSNKSNSNTRNKTRMGVMFKDNASLEEVRSTHWKNTIISLPLAILIVLLFLFFWE